MDKKQTVKYILYYVIITYAISGIGYGIWLQAENGESAAAFIPVLAPLIGVLLVYFKSGRQIELHIRAFSIRGVIIGMLIPVVMIIVSVGIFLVMGNTMKPLHTNGQELAGLCLQWIFAGFCEELGWRCVLLPLLKKLMKLQYASALTGVIWAGWHMPLILGGLMITGQTRVVGVVMFLIEAVAISIILGVISENKMGRSVWTYVSYHAFQNIIIAILLNSITNSDYGYLDDGGYILVAVICAAAAIAWIVRTVRLKYPCSR